VNGCWGEAGLPAPAARAGSSSETMASLAADLLCFPARRTRVPPRVETSACHTRPGRLGEERDMRVQIILRGRVLALLIGLLTALAAPGDARAAALLDVSVEISTNTGPNGNLFSIARGEYAWAQTFTVGRAGALTSVALQVARESGLVTQPLLLDIRPTAGGVPLASEAAALVTASVPPNTFPLHAGVPAAFTSIPLGGGGIPVTPGTVLALVLRSNEPNISFDRGYAWASSPQAQDVYPAGDAFVREPGSSSFLAMAANPLTVRDHGFRTFVEVPDPTGVGVMGLMAVVALRRGRRRV
jgi:hypothetical protein